MGLIAAGSRCYSLMAHPGEIFGNEIRLVDRTARRTDRTDIDRSDWRSTDRYSGLAVRRRRGADRRLSDHRQNILSRDTGRVTVGCPPTNRSHSTARSCAEANRSPARLAMAFRQIASSGRGTRRLCQRRNRISASESQTPGIGIADTQNVVDTWSWPESQTPRMWWTPGYGRWLGVTTTAHRGSDISAVG